MSEHLKMLLFDYHKESFVLLTFALLSLKIIISYPDLIKWYVIRINNSIVDRNSNGCIKFDRYITSSFFELFTWEFTLTE